MAVSKETVMNAFRVFKDTLDTVKNGTSNATVFTGATGLAGGASGLVPAPAAGDNEKFLRGDGSWVAVSGGGQSYSIATTTQAGLMSAEDKQHLDAVFQDSADLTDAVITVVGGKFLPSVDSAADFNTYKDSNLSFLDNKLKKIFDGTPLKTYASDGDFQHGAVAVYIDGGDGANYSLCSDANAITVEAYRASVESYFTLYKMSESAGFIIRTADATKNGHTYSGSQILYGFNVSKSERVSLIAANHTIAAAASTVASANAYTDDCTIIPSAQDPGNLMFITARYSNDNCTYTYSDACVGVHSGAVTTLKAETTIGTDYTWGSGTAGKTNIDNVYNDFSRPKATFANGKVKINTTTSKILPFVFYEKRIRNSSGDETGGGDYVLFCRGTNRASPQTLQLTTISGGATSTLCPWFEDDDNLIAGLWRSKSSENWYVITFKEGTYDYSADWYDKCSTVWGIDFLTPRFIRLTKKLSQVIDDLVL